MIPLLLTKPVGKNCPNVPQDVNALVKRLVAIGKLSPALLAATAMNPSIMKAIMDVQRHWMAMPDGIVSVQGRTHKYLQTWSCKPISVGVQLPGRLQEAWNWVNPLLPEGSYCSSGFRSAETQRKILQNFFVNTYKAAIVQKYSQKSYDAVAIDLLKNEVQVLEMVRGVGQAIAAPGKSAHQLGKAIDIGGPATIDQKQVETVQLVARAHPTLFSGKVLKERNGCVHFEIR